MCIWVKYGHKNFDKHVNKKIGRTIDRPIINKYRHKYRDSDMFETLGGETNRREMT